MKIVWVRMDLCADNFTFLKLVKIQKINKLTFEYKNRGKSQFLPILIYAKFTKYLKPSN